MTGSKNAFARLFRTLLFVRKNGVEINRGLYDVSYKKNSPHRMRTVTLENQYQRLVESATPLARHPYERQLEIKKSALEKALRKVVNIIKHNKRGIFTAEMEKMADENCGCICPLVDFKPSPKPEGFRNKEMLTIRRGADGDPNTIGLVIGRGPSGICVANDVLRNSKPLTFAIVKTFKSFLSQSRFRRREAQSEEAAGFWCNVLIRSNEEGHVMLVPELACTDMSQESIDQAKKELMDFYCNGLQMQHGVQSLYLRLRHRGHKTHYQQYHLAGDTHIYEQVLGYHFRISPEAFFQLNTPGAGVLYTVLQDLVSASQSHSLLDIGCGTGTISLVTSSLVERVIGLDIVQEAVEDARFNAALNDVRNATFYVGSARKLLKSFLLEGDKLTDDTVAVVNPNRNGLSKKAIMRLRCCEAVKHLIFISCKPHGNALVNFADLIVPESEDHLGKPFKAVQAIGVDMFPQTIHSELVLLFQR